MVNEGENELELEEEGGGRGDGWMVAVCLWLRRGIERRYRGI
jgi:hypothetical protein